MFNTPGTCVTLNERSCLLLYIIRLWANLCNVTERKPPWQFIYTTAVALTSLTRHYNFQKQQEIAQSQKNCPPHICLKEQLQTSAIYGPSLENTPLPSQWSTCCQSFPHNNHIQVVTNSEHFWVSPLTETYQAYIWEDISHPAAGEIPSAESPPSSTAPERWQRLLRTSAYQKTMFPLWKRGRWWRNFSLTLNSYIILILNLMSANMSQKCWDRATKDYKK